MLGLAFKFLCFLLGVAAVAGLLVLEGLRPETAGGWLAAIRIAETVCCGVILFALYECLLKKKLWAILIPKPVRALAVTLLALAAALAAVLETALVVAADHTGYPAPDDECIFVPGSRLGADALPAALRRKLETALALHQTAPHLPILVAGGAHPGDRCTEAAAMKQYLIFRGVPEDRILAEPGGLSLRERFLRSQPLLDARFGAHPHRLVLVTEPHEIFRAVRVGERAGCRITPHAPAADWRDWPRHPREWWFILREWITPGSTP